MGDSRRPLNTRRNNFSLNSNRPSSFNTVNSAVLAADLFQKTDVENNKTARNVNTVLDPGDLFSARDRAKKIGTEAALLDAFDSIPDQERLTDAQGNLRSQFSAENAFNNSEFNKRLAGLTNFGEATPIAQRLLEVQNTSNQQAVNNLAAQQAGQLNQGISALARQGGISGGARERLAANAFNQGLLARQNQGFQNQQTVQQINADDANRQLGILTGLSGAQARAAQQDSATAAADVLSANENEIARGAARSEAILNARNAPKGGLGGAVSGIFGK